jgi:hypothetical protein
VNIAADSSRNTAAQRRSARIAEHVDRLFPLGWIGFALLLPVSGWSTVAFQGWFDQRRDLGALESVIATGRADAVAESGVGPAYIAVATWIHSAVRVVPQDALIVLNRASYILSVAVGMVLVRLLVRRLVAAPAAVSLAAQLVFVTIALAAGTWYWSDVPWSHFFAALLGVSFYAARCAWPRVPFVSAIAVGALLTLLALTRTFELAALLLAWVIVAVVLRFVRPKEPSGRSWSIRHVAVGAGACILTAAAVGLATGKQDAFILYSSNLDYETQGVQTVAGAETPTFSFGLVPVKLVQLFVEPCYYSLCSISDYSVDAAAGIPGNVRLWSLPLLIQLPALALLPLCVLGLGGLVFWFARNRSAGAGRLRELGLMLEMTIAACGLVIGYAASTLTGPSHLRFGFARDFLLPALLSGIVATTLLSAGLWLLVARRSPGRWSQEFSFVALSFVGVGAVVLGVALARTQGLPRIDAKHLETVTYRARCEAGTCDVALIATTPGGTRISIPDASTLTFDCGPSHPRLSVYSTAPGAGIRLPASCAEPRLVAAWPTVMGLPPSGNEIAAVAVENA